MTQIIDRQMIYAILKDVTGEEENNISDSSKLTQDLGIDSLQFVRLILEIEMKSQRKIFNVLSISKLETVGDLINECLKKGGIL